MFFKTSFLFALMTAGLAQEIFKCPDKNGKYPSSSDCKIYYDCINGLGYPKDCGVGQLFNPNTSTCETQNPELEKVCAALFKCPEPNGRFASNKNPAAYYECVNGTATFVNCEPNAKFKVSQNGCVIGSSTGIAGLFEELMGPNLLTIINPEKGAQAGAFGNNGTGGTKTQGISGLVQYLLSPNVTELVKPNEP